MSKKMPDLPQDCINVIISFLPIQAMAKFAAVSKGYRDKVYDNLKLAIETNAVAGKLTSYQMNTLANLGTNPGIGHYKALTERLCIVCKQNYRGSIRAPFCLPAHDECVKGLETCVRYVDGGPIPADLMALVRKEIPVGKRGGYRKSVGQFTYETIIPKVRHDCTLHVLCWSSI